MVPDLSLLAKLESEIGEQTRSRLNQAVQIIVAAKKRGGKIAVVTGSGPNLHEGVTTLVAELMRVGLVDGVTTSSAVVAHEMGGTLDRVKRCDGVAVGVAPHLLPRGGEFELTLLNEATLAELAQQLPLDHALMARMMAASGKSIIKAAGNLGYPMGLWLEHLAAEILMWAQAHGRSFEEIAGLGSDPQTMIGIGARLGLPVLVTIPQLVGGGAVGLAIGDSISLTERSRRVARLLADADVIIESGVALTQEIHDGPFETYTGHGLWAAWRAEPTFSLQGKHLIRIDLDPALEQVWNLEQGGGAVQNAIAGGLPKTKQFGVPFRMEMSGFARHEGSLPLIGDLGALWPLIAWKSAQELSIELQFLSYPQQTAAGQSMREAIVHQIQPVQRKEILKRLPDSHPSKTLGIRPSPI